MATTAKLTAEQELRDKYMEILLTGPNRISVQDAMLKTGPIVDFVQHGTILGIDGGEALAPLRRGHRASDRA